MAPIKLGKLVSVSSEDPSYPAENLLKHEYSKCKWKCKVAGEKQAVVEFQLEKPTKITAIDVGNEFSAFIEILVCKSCTPDDYKVLLVASSLMSLQDAKYGSNGNEVRFFKTENLTKPVADEKWDRLKVICTQPYNKMIQYGLCFIIIRSSSENDSSQDNALTLGKFKLKPESTVDPISVGSIYKKKENNKKQERKENKPVTNRHQKDAAGSTSVNGSLNKRNSYSSTPKKSPKKLKHTDVDPKNKPRREKKWDKLLDDVVFVISGFQNPLRADIRSKALAMGAKYKADWDSSCTHLVCAFTNTPKFNQVRGSGKIVKKDWIEECYSKRMRFPWRR
ncbi:hypothetical protein AAG570_008668 [Ranatra chinensis]|uniref:BRCT domain-containing protein n=1 Tax=Ranatra chinensis TaxID=642074 RepID=A0ABD0YRJ5_9HEMI